MQLCSGGTKRRHGEVCYSDDEANCPVCACNDDMLLLENELSDAHTKIEELEAELKDLKAELKELEGC
jgi:chromosome segregation ATPase